MASGKLDNPLSSRSNATDKLILSDGFKMQWGSSNTRAITFDVPYDSPPKVFVTMATGDTGTTYLFGPMAVSTSKTGFTIVEKFYAASTNQIYNSGTEWINWLAIGY